MAIAISTVAQANNGNSNGAVTTLTTGGFNTPSGNSLLVVLFTSGDVAGSVSSITDSLGSHLTYHNITGATVSAASTTASMWLADCSAANTGMTVTPTFTSMSAPAVFVVVLTGAAVYASQNGKSNTQTSTSAALPSVTLTSLVGSNSMVLGCANNNDTATLGSAGTNQSETFPSSGGTALTYTNTANGSAGWAQYDTRINLASGSNDTLNDTAPSCVHTMAALEIIAAATSSAVWLPGHQAPDVRLPSRRSTGRMGAVVPPSQDVPMPLSRARAMRQAGLQARGRRVTPVPPQVPVPVLSPKWRSIPSRGLGSRKGRIATPVPITAVTPPSYSPVKLGAPRRLLSGAQKGRQVSPVPAQVPVPVWSPKWRSIPSRVMGLRKGRQATPVPTQATVTTPSWPPRQVSSERRLMGLVARGKQWSSATMSGLSPINPPIIYAPLTTAGRQFRRLLRAPGRRSVVVPAQVPVPKYPPPKLGAPRRLLSVGTRGRSWLAAPAQIPVPKPVFPNRIPHLRFGLLRRTKLPYAPPAVISQPPTICYPTSVVLASYGSQALIPSHGSAVVFSDHESATVLFNHQTAATPVAHDTKTVFADHESRVGIADYESKAQPVGYQSGVTHLNTCDD